MSAIDSEEVVVVLPLVESAGRLKLKDGAKAADDEARARNENPNKRMFVYQENLKTAGVLLDAVGLLC